MVKQGVLTLHRFFWSVELFISLRRRRLTSEESEKDIRGRGPATELKPCDRSVGVAWAIDLEKATQALGIRSCQGKEDFVPSTGLKKKTFRSELPNHKFG